MSQRKFDPYKSAMPNVAIRWAEQERCLRMYSTDKQYTTEFRAMQVPAANTSQVASKLVGCGGAV